MNSMHPSDGARAAVVNRTHRVLRARAVAMNSQRDRMRSLWLPLALCASVVVVLLFAGIDLMNPVADAAPDSLLATEAGSLMPVLLMWFLPLTIAAGVVVWVRRSRSENRKEL